MTTTMITSFSEWLVKVAKISLGDGNLDNGEITQSQFSTQYQAWLKQLVSFDEVKAYLGIEGVSNDSISFNINQNDSGTYTADSTVAPTTGPILLINGVPASAEVQAKFWDAFSERYEIDVITGTIKKTGAVNTQDRYVSDSFVLPATNTAPTLKKPEEATIEDSEDNDMPMDVVGQLEAEDNEDDAITFILDGGEPVLDSDGNPTDEVSKTSEYGTLFLNTKTGAYRFEPNDMAINALKPGQTPSVSFTVQATDGLLPSEPQAIVINVTGANDTPIFNPEGLASVAATEDGDVERFSALEGVSDAENDTLTVVESSIKVTPEGGVTFVSGEFLLDPKNAVFQNLGEGVTRDVTVTYQVTDGNGGTVDVTRTFTVTGVNDAPTDIGFNFLPLSSPVAGGTIATLSTTDVDSGDTATYSIVSTTKIDGDDRTFSLDGNRLNVTAQSGGNTDGGAIDRYKLTIQTTDSDLAFHQEDIFVTIGTNKSNNNLGGNTGNDVIYGFDSDNGQKTDVIMAGDGDDVIFGGLGRDVMTGGAGKDIFAYSTLEDSKTDARDLITDFVRGEDKISVAALTQGDSSKFKFVWITEIFPDPTKNLTTVLIDVNGDRQNDLFVQLTGAKELTVDDFII